MVFVGVLWKLAPVVLQLQTAGRVIQQIPIYIMVMWNPISKNTAQKVKNTGKKSY